MDGTLGAGRGEEMPSGQGEARKQLPPGQRRVPALRRFGTHLHDQPPAVPADPTIIVTGAGTTDIVLPLEALRSLPRTRKVADFHCVAGWSVTDLSWEGVSFATFFREVVAPALPPGTSVTHIVTEGLDGYRCPVLLRDAMRDDVLIADALDGAPLTPSNGAPLRYVSPSQYGFVSNKHLCRIEVHTGEPVWKFGSGSIYGRAMLPPLFARHPRARVWAEERNPWLPNRLLRPVYRVISAPIAWLSNRGVSPTR
jgi:DMSO/TMAO reductase YedYZ molybdopterin-dependent catalytic subunit